jgi:hypothetical protein
MSEAIWGINRRCGCGINTCCRMDGICCKKEKCRKRCRRPERINLSEINVVFYTTDIVDQWQGIRWLRHDNTYILVGTQGSSGVVNIGPLNSLSQTIYPVNVPGAVATSVYGPDVPNVNEAPIRLVGTFRNTNPTPVLGFLFRGTVEELNDGSKYRTIQVGATFTFAHSVMKDLVVGTNDNLAQHNTFNLPLGPINAFVYNIETGNKDKIHFPGSVSNAAYGIWHNGGTRYTICGGYSFNPVEITSVYVSRNGVALPIPFGCAFLVDFDSRSRCFKNWTTFTYPERNIVTHFQGISAVPDRRNFYQLAADSADISATNITQGSWVEIKRETPGDRDRDRDSDTDSDRDSDDDDNNNNNNNNRRNRRNRDTRCGRDRFRVKKWVDINFPDAGLNAANSVSGNAVVGFAEVNNTLIPYQAQLLVRGFD